MGTPVDKKESSQPLSMKKYLLLSLLIAVMCLAIVLLRFFVIDYYNVPSESMENTIMTNDFILANKLEKNNSNFPKQGDIVVFKSPVSNVTLVKRVVATESQKIDLKDGMLFIDNKKVDELYVTGETRTLDNSDVEFPLTVPENKVFVLGDNRENSLDSRFFGCIDKNSIKGKVTNIIFPFEHIKTL